MENITFKMDMHPEGEPKVPYSPNDDLDSNGLLKMNDQNGRYFPVAIVGIGLRMPDAETVAEFENVMIEGRCAIKPIPADRWHFEDFYDSDPHTKGHYCIPKLAFCDKFFHFDPGYFNICPREANFIDPQQRQTLEIADEALQDAGYTKDTLPKDTGVYVGMGIMDFPGSLVENRYLFNGHSLTGISQSCAANRISHHYGLTGPSIAVDTACAASLTALHVGCMSLWNHENKVALAGATSNIFSPETTVAFSHLGVLSATGNSAPFDESNNGYVRGEGTSIVVMKPLEDAIRDGDHIYCVIRASTSAHNGNSNSLTLPSADAQEELIRRCYSQSGVPLEKISFVEAHGTGTPVGDPLETRALGRTFGAARRAASLGPLPIQSAKSNFGHLEVCAGMVQVVKTALMLEKRFYYKQINWTAPNPRINFDDLHMYIPVTAAPYTRYEKFVIGVNTFGFGGSLVHMIFEEYRPRIKAIAEKEINQARWSFGSERKRGRKIAIPLSAKVGIALRNTVEKWLTWEDPADAQSVVGWLATRRDHFIEHRMVVLANSGVDFRNKLRRWLDGEEQADVITGSKAVIYEKPSVCMVYPGWGQQHIDMGRNLYKNSPTFKAAVDECDIIFRKLSGYSALEKFLIFIDDPNKDKSPDMIDGAACKPGILFLQVGLTHLLASWGVKPDVVMGIGLGEQIAAYASGAMSLDTIIKLMHIRMTSPPKDDFLKEVRSTLNGSNPSSSKFISTVTGKKFDGILNADYWWQNVASEKKAAAAIDSALEQNPNTIFIEVAASPCLKSVIQTAADKYNVANNVFFCGEKNINEWDTAQQMMASLHVSGYSVNWQTITRNLASYAPIPLYGWDDVLYRVEATDFGGRRKGITDRSYKNAAGKVNMDLFGYLRDYTLHDEMVFPAAGYLEYFSEYDYGWLAALKDIKVLTNLKLLPMATNGYLQNVSLELKRHKSHLSIVTHAGEVVAEATHAKAKHRSNPPKLAIECIKNRCSDIKEGSAVYNKFAKEGLAYGMFFRLITQIHIGDMEALSVCCAPHSTNRFERIETLVLDNAYQTAIAAFTNGPSIYMPSAVGRLQMFVEKVPPATKFCVHAKLNEWSQTSILCDIMVADCDGNVWLILENVKADNTAELESDVNYDTCCYTTKWQSSKAKMQYSNKLEVHLTNADTATTVGASHKLYQLKPLISALSCEALGQVQNPLISAKLNRLSDMDSSQKSSDILSEQLLNSTTATSCDMSNLRNIAECIAKLPESDCYDHHVIEFLRQSSVVRNLIAPYIDMIKAKIMEAQVHKDVIRVCEFGAKSAVLTKMIVHSLADEIESTKVDYTFAGHDGETFRQVNEYLADLPAINFEQLNEDTIAKLQGSYDLVISLALFDNESVSLEIVKGLLAHEGLVVLLTSSSCHFITDFVSLTRDSQVAMDASMLTNAGFVELLDSCCSDKSVVTVLIGQKAGASHVRATPRGSITIIHNNMPDVAKDLSAQLAIECQIYSMDVFDADALNNKKAVTVIFLLGNDPDVDETMDLLTLLSTQEEDIIKIAYGIAGTGDPGNNTASCVGILQQMRRNCPFPLYAIDIRSTNHLVPVIASAMYDISKSDWQIRVENNEMKVPRIMPYDVVHNASKDYAWQLNFVQREGELSVKYHGIQISTLMPDDVKISIRAVAMNENSSDSVIAYAGRVEDTGSSVNTLVIGDAVMGLGRAPLSSHIVCDAQNVQRKPNNLSWAEAADSLLSYCTVYNALTEQANIKPGETILIHPSQGSLCQAAANIVRLKGARVISTYNDASEYVNAVQRLGVITIANPYDLCFKKYIMNLTNNAGIDAVLQLTSDDLPSTCDDIMAYGVRICKLGATRSTVSSIPNARYSALHLSSYMKRSEKRVQNIVRLVADNLDSGTLLPVNEEVSHIANATADLQTLSNTTMSKTVVFEIPDDYVPSQIQSVDFRLRSDATYIVTGGYSRLGLELSRWLSDKGAKHVAMISSEKKRSVFGKATQKYMECNNTKVYCIEKSISSPEDARSIIKDLQQRCTQPIRGIFNLAGYDANLTSHDPDDIKLTLSTQFLSVQLLDQESVSLNLDHFVVFTSVDTIRGTETLTSRAAVGAALEALCEARRTAGRCGLCLQLGQIRGVGASGSDNQELSEMTEAAGSKSLHFQEYLTILGSLLQKDDLPTTVAITNQDWNKTLATNGSSCLTYKHLCTVNGIEETSGGVDERELIIQKCKDFVGSLTGSNPDIIDSSHPMTEYGVDSLMSQDIINWAQKTFKVTLLQTAIFGGLTIDQLLDKV